MIDPGKLLGGLLGSVGNLGALGDLGGLAKNSLPNSAALGVGLLGVAMAAFEHFAAQKNSPVGTGGFPTPPPAPPGLSGPSNGPPPMPLTFPRSTPGVGAYSGAGSVTPPPLPGSSAGLPPAVSPLKDTGTSIADPVLLIRAMIAAANADGVLDDTERMRILSQLEGVDLTEEEKDFLCTEFDRPWSAAALAATVISPVVAAQVFTVSLLAVDVDTPAERDYFVALRMALGLEEQAAVKIARRVGRTLD